METNVILPVIVVSKTKQTADIGRRAAEYNTWSLKGAGLNVVQ
jgi:hypothetical protein